MRKQTKHAVALQKYRVKGWTFLSHGKKKERKEREQNASWTPKGNFKSLWMLKISSSLFGELNLESKTRSVRTWGVKAHSSPDLKDIIADSAGHRMEELFYSCPGQSSYLLAHMLNPLSSKQTFLPASHRETERRMKQRKWHFSSQNGYECV